MFSYISNLLISLACCLDKSSIIVPTKFGPIKGNLVSCGSNVITLKCSTKYKMIINKLFLMHRFDGNKIIVSITFP